MPKSRLNDNLFDSSFTKFSLKWCITRRCTVSVLRQDYDQCFIKQWRQTDCKVQQRPASWLGYSFQYITDIPACIRHVDIDLRIIDTPSHVYAEFWTHIIYSSLFQNFVFFLIYFQRFSTSKEESFWIRIEKCLRVFECNFNQLRFLEEKSFRREILVLNEATLCPCPSTKLQSQGMKFLLRFLREPHSQSAQGLAKSQNVPLIIPSSSMNCRKTPSQGIEKRAPRKCIS